MPVHFEGKVRINKINMGPYDNNGYIVVCTETNEGIIIDTPAEPEKLLNEIGDVKIGHILITHNHQDHLLGFDEITGSVGAPVGIGTEDASALPRPPEVDLKDGDVIKFGNQELQVLATPGHTDGAMCLLVGKHLFSGDTLFPGGPGKTRSPEALQQIIASITQIAGKLGTVAVKVDFYKSVAANTTFDGRVWRARSVTHYRSPAERTVAAGGV